jgi:hypothetical protein
MHSDDNIYYIDRDVYQELLEMVNKFEGRTDQQQERLARIAEHTSELTFVRKVFTALFPSVDTSSKIRGD